MVAHGGRNQFRMANDPHAALRRDLPRELPDGRLREAFAVSRLTSLLKLLCWPSAVVSCTNSAKPLSSNFWSHSSHSMCSSDCSPLNPGKSRRRMPTSSPPPVPRTQAGRALRSSAHWRISSCSMSVRAFDFDRRGDDVREELPREEAVREEAPREDRDPADVLLPLADLDASLLLEVLLLLEPLVLLELPAEPLF